MNEFIMVVGAAIGIAALLVAYQWGYWMGVKS